MHDFILSRIYSVAKKLLYSKHADIVQTRTVLIRLITNPAQHLQLAGLVRKTTCEEVGHAYADSVSALVAPR